METKMISKKRDWGKEFIEAWNSVHEGILIAAKIYVEAIDEDPANREVIYEAAKGLATPRDFRQLEAVGRQSLDYRLLTGSCGPHTAKIKKLPGDLQTKVIDGCMFEFLTADGSKMMICLRDCEDYQAKQMFADNHIRNLSDQKAWIEAEKAKRNTDEVIHKMPYEFRPDGLLIKENTLFTYEEAASMFSECMKNRPKRKKIS